MNINNPTTFGTPSLTLSTSNSSGTGGALRADDTVLVYDTTNPTTIAYSASPAVGSSSTSARRDHTHGMAASAAPATKAEMEAAESTTVFATAGRTVFAPGVAKVWVSVAADGESSLATYNCASSDSGVGVRTVTYGDDFSNEAYAAVGSAGAPSTFDCTATIIGQNVFAVGSCDIIMRSSGATANVDAITFAAFYGDQ